MSPTPTPMMPSEPILSPAQIDQQYTSTMDSVNLINALIAQAVKTADDYDTIERNVRHVKIMLSKTFWTTHDTAPFNSAIMAGKEALDKAPPRPAAV